MFIFKWLQVFHACNRMILHGLRPHNTNTPSTPWQKNLWLKAWDLTLLAGDPSSATPSALIASRSAWRGGVLTSTIHRFLNAPGVDPVAATLLYAVIATAAELPEDPGT